MAVQCNDRELFLPCTPLSISLNVIWVWWCYLVRYFALNNVQRVPCDQFLIGLADSRHSGIKYSMWLKEDETPVLDNKQVGE